MKYNFKDLEPKVLKEVLDAVEASDDGLIDTELFEKAFPIVLTEGGEEMQFDTSAEVSSFLISQGIPQGQQFKYVFTCIDGDDGMRLSNGWHMCNRLFYLVTTNSWSTGNEEHDSSLMIDTKY